MKYSEKKIIETVKINQSIEGINISIHTENMVKDLISGRKSESQLLEEIKNNHKKRVANRTITYV